MRYFAMVLLILMLFTPSRFAFTFGGRFRTIHSPLRSIEIKKPEERPSYVTGLSVLNLLLEGVRTVHLATQLQRDGETQKFEKTRTARMKWIGNQRIDMRMLKFPPRVG